VDEKPETPTAQLAAIDQVTLVPLVRSALSSTTVEVIDWEYKQLHGGLGAGSTIYRFAGQGHEQGQTAPWSLILKALHPQAPADDPSAWNYYKREADAYQSGWLADLPGGMAAPRCFGVVEHPDGTCWIWLEDVADEIGPHWPLEHYRVVARHAGHFNGAYLVDRLLPSWPWISVGWVRKYVEQAAPVLPLLRDSLDHPLVRRAWPGDAIDRFFRLWEEHDLFLDALDRLPQTICHLDVFRRNLFARKTADADDQTVAVDWAFAGRGAIGQELVSLVQASVMFYEVGPDKAQALEDIVFDGYLEGLRDAGWRGDARQVRLGYAAASLRYRCGGELGRFLTIILDESLHDIAQQTFGRPIGEVADFWAYVGHLFDGTIDEARALIDALA
jgi:hypothetical protein